MGQRQQGGKDCRLGSWRPAVDVDWERCSCASWLGGASRPAHGLRRHCAAGTRRLRRETIGKQKGRNDKSVCVLSAADSQANRFAIRKNGNGKGRAAATDGAETGTDYASKLLHLAWHPEVNVIAAAASNSLYMYCA